MKTYEELTGLAAEIEALNLKITKLEAELAMYKSLSDALKFAIDPKNVL